MPNVHCPTKELAEKVYKYYTGGTPIEWMLKNHGDKLCMRVESKSNEAMYGENISEYFHDVIPAKEYLKNKSELDNKPKDKKRKFYY